MRIYMLLRKPLDSPAAFLLSVCYLLVASYIRGTKRFSLSLVSSRSDCHCLKFSIKSLCSISNHFTLDIPAFFHKSIRSQIIQGQIPGPCNTASWQLFSRVFVEQGPFSALRVAGFNLEPTAGKASDSPVSYYPHFKNS